MSKEATLNKIQVPKTARYFQLGEISDQTKHIWYVFHGYGQLAEYFIKHFEGILKDETVIIAPEGISRFYLEGVMGRVGASWMTKIDRLDEIEDQKAYLNTLHKHIFEQIPRNDVTLTVLGFSQGVATSWRWVKTGGVIPDNFILWAGSVPEEFPENRSSRFEKISFFAVLGKKDQYISQEKAIEYKEKLEKIHPSMQWFSFDGDHRLDQEVLKLIGNKIQMC